MNKQMCGDCGTREGDFHGDGCDLERYNLNTHHTKMIAFFLCSIYSIIGI